MIVRVKVVFRKTVVGDLASNHLPNNNNNISLINLSSTTRAIFLRRTSNDGSEHDSNGESKCFSLQADPLWTKGNNNQLKMSDQQVSMGWSPKPIVGHCSDTLCNNSGHSAIELWIPFHWPHPWHYSPHPSTHTHTGHFIKLTWCLKCMENTAWTKMWRCFPFWQRINSVQTINTNSASTCEGLPEPTLSVGCLAIL